MTTRTKVILGLVGAAAAGVIVGLLVAPEKGSDMRRKVGETATDWADRLTDLFNNAKGEVDNLKTRGADMAKSAANKFGSVQESYS
ncbi:MAG TPA: YtxH domain-containing protein [Flavisolibacter sp.]|jgi:gas vesicle protein